MTFAVRGVIEGFYGRPWSWAERAGLIDFLAANGYNMFVYAPKNEPLHRKRWHEPYLPVELRRFKGLLDRCQGRNIEFVFGISPMKFHYTDPAMFELLWQQKILPMYAMGVRSFSLLLDDMPDRFHYPDDGDRFPSIAHAQAWLNNALLARFETVGGVDRLIFCPTEYCGEGVSPYLETLGAELRPEIDIFWTGTEVCAQYLKTADAQKVAATLRRPVLYWDNYPVNDGPMQERPHMRPIRGRDTNLGSACRGIVANASLQPEISKIPLHTYGAFMQGPSTYEPEAAWQAALLAVAGNEADAAAVAALGDLTRWSAVERGKSLHNHIAPLLQRFWQTWGGAPAVAGPEIADQPEPPAPPTTTGAGDRLGAIADLEIVLTELEATVRHLQGPMQNPRLQAELAPWTDKLDRWLQAMRAALATLRLSLAVPPSPADQLAAAEEATLDALQAARESMYWVAGDLFDHFIRRCLWAAAERND
ncbi:MAG TPA: protein O-GlcNAcase [Symbiobacteriaceae bacterium]|nr:protein O-GlcNAcase [Symbiobacteriaceae bacterium]